VNSFLNIRQYGILAVLLLLIVLFSFASPAFFTTSNLINIARQVSMLGIVSVGFTFVLLTGGIDLSVGSIISIVGIISAYSMVDGGLHPVLAIIIGIVVAIVIGIVNGVLVTKTKLSPLIATLATMTIVKGLAFIISGGLPIFGFPSWFAVIGQGYIGPIPIPVIIMVIVFLIGSFILNRTYYGRYIYAIGGNEEAARLSGLNINKLKLLVYSLCGFFTGIAGIIMLARINSGQPVAGIGFEFDVLTAVVLGGVSISGGAGKLSGVLTGVLIMGVLNNGLILMNIGEYYQLVIKGVVLLVAVGLDSWQQNRKKTNRTSQNSNKEQTTATASAG